MGQLGAPGTVNSPNSVANGSATRPMYGLSAVFTTWTSDPLVSHRADAQRQLRRRQERKLSLLRSIPRLHHRNPRARRLEPQAQRARRRRQVPPDIPLFNTKRNGSSTNHADYNSFIQGRAAAGHADILAYSSSFSAVRLYRGHRRPRATPAPPTRPPTRECPSTGWTEPGWPTSTRTSTTEIGTTKRIPRTSPATIAPTSKNDLTTNYPITGCNQGVPIYWLGGTKGTEKFVSGNSKALGTTSITVGVLDASNLNYGPLSSNEEQPRLPQTDQCTDSLPFSRSRQQPIPAFRTIGASPPASSAPVTSSGSCSYRPPHVTPRRPTSRTTTPSSRTEPPPATPTYRPTAMALRSSVAPKTTTPATTPAPPSPVPTEGSPSTG